MATADYHIFEVVCKTNKTRFISRTKYRDLDRCIESTLFSLDKAKDDKTDTPLFNIIKENNYSYDTLERLYSSTETDARKLQQKYIDTHKNSTDYKLVNMKDAFLTAEKKKQTARDNYEKHKSAITKWFYYKLTSENGKRYYITKSIIVYTDDYYDFINSDTKNKHNVKPEIEKLKTFGAVKVELLDEKDLALFASQEHHQNIINYHKEQDKKNNRENQDSENITVCLNRKPVYFTKAEWFDFRRNKKTNGEIMEMLDKF